MCLSVSFPRPPFIDPTAETPLVARRVAWPARQKRDISNRRDSKRRDTLVPENTRRAKLCHLLSLSSLSYALDNSAEGEEPPFFLTPNPNLVREMKLISLCPFHFFFFLFHLFRLVKKCIRHPLHVAVLNLAWLVWVYRDGCSLDRDQKIQPLSHNFWFQWISRFIFFFFFSSFEGISSVSLFSVYFFSRFQIRFRIIFLEMIAEIDEIAGLEGFKVEVIWLRVERCL